jgi:hypothetical protein
LGRRALGARRRLNQQTEEITQFENLFLFITGWNEWIAGSWLANPGGSVSTLGNPCPLDGYYFVDEYNEEYSRDIEPMKGYYYQMVGQNRLRKGARPIPAASVPQAINLTGGFSQWTNVSPAYYDPVNDTDWLGRLRLCRKAWRPHRDHDDLEPKHLDER